MADMVKYAASTSNSGASSQDQVCIVAGDPYEAVNFYAVQRVAIRLRRDAVKKEACSAAQRRGKEKSAARAPNRASSSEDAAGSIVVVLRCGGIHQS